MTINEVQANNVGRLRDPQETNETPDWIELHNPSAAPITIGGLHLTNDPADSTKFKIPAGMRIPANGFVVFYADDDSEQGNRHTNFTLAARYGYVGLFSADGLIQIDALTYRNMAENASVARVPDGDGAPIPRQSCTTPGALNVCATAFLPLLK